jgi:hypothetical protein
VRPAPFHALCVLTLGSYINFIPKQKEPDQLFSRSPHARFTIFVNDIQFKMKAFLLPLAVLASSAMAQTTAACGADYIVEACLGTENAKLANCKDQDWDCMCAQWQNIITYGNTSNFLS